MKNPFQLLQTPPPFQDDKIFEKFVRDYFNHIENTLNYTLYGRSGQNQSGVDVISIEKRTAIQCKLRTIGYSKDETIRKSIIKELHTDFTSFLDYKTKNNLSINKYIFASTFKADTIIEDECNKLSQQHSITVEYWSWSRLISNIHSETLRNYYGDLLSLIETYYSETEEYQGIQPLTIHYNFDYSIHILDRVYNYFRHLYDQLGYVPISFLKNNYPFKVSESYYPHYSTFSLSTDNQEFFQLLYSLEIEEDNIRFSDRGLVDGVANPYKKIKEILGTLSSQLIYQIRHSKSRKFVDITYFQNKPCDCVLCLLTSYDFKPLISKLNIEPRKLEDTLRFAYIHYQIGNYIKAAEYYEKSAKMAKKASKNLLYVTIQFSLSNLYNHINKNYWGDEIDQNLLNRLKTISANQVLKEVKHEHKEFVTWVFNTYFFTTKFEQISHLVSKIRDSYYNQLNGGTSSNSYVFELINSYAETDTFLERNRIVYNRFSEYDDLTKLFIEGLFLSHAIRSEGSSRLEEFNDWLFQKILLFGKTEDIKKYFYRYDVGELYYKPHLSNSNTFIALANNFLKNQDLAISTFEPSEHPNFRFWERYTKIFNNILVLLALTNIPDNDVRNLANRIYDFVKKRSGFEISFIDNLQLFITRKGKVLELDTLQNFLNLYSHQNVYHNYLYVKTLIYQLIEKDPNFILNDMLQETLITNELDDCLMCGTKHYYKLLPEIYNAINDNNFKLRIKKTIEKKLKKELDTTLYYESVIHDVINYKHYFSKFIKSIPKTLDKTNIKNVLSRTKSKRHKRLNELINICYKNQIDLNAKQFTTFRGLDDYYDWLLNLEKFDYKKFNPIWVTEYPTLYYYQEFAKHPIIKSYITDKLKKEKNRKLVDSLVEITIAESKENH